MGNKKRGHLSTVEKSRQGGAPCSVRVPASSCAIALITIVHNWQKFLGHTDCKFHLLVEYTPPPFPIILQGHNSQHYFCVDRRWKIRSSALCFVIFVQKSEQALRKHIGIAPVNLQAPPKLGSDEILLQNILPVKKS